MRGNLWWTDALGNRKRDFGFRFCGQRLSVGEIFLLPGMPLATLVHDLGATQPAPGSFSSRGFSSSGSLAILAAMRRASSTY
jgi:hypothetical protein